MKFQPVTTSCTQLQPNTLSHTQPHATSTNHLQPQSTHLATTYTTHSHYPLHTATIYYTQPLSTTHSHYPLHTATTHNTHNHYPLHTATIHYTQPLSTTCNYFQPSTHTATIDHTTLTSDFTTLAANYKMTYEDSITPSIEHICTNFTKESAREALTHVIRNSWLHRLEFST